MAVGDNGLILRTYDGGNIWTIQTSGLPNSLNAVLLTDVNTATVVGNNGIILRTTDGGLNWCNQQSNTDQNLLGVAFFNSNIGIVVGDSGIILHTTNGGVTFIEEGSNPTQPNSFLLSQNYPNPFNPSTTISYSVPELSFVTLKVYDVLGSEVAVLLNEEKSAGAYEVEFEEGRLSSGIYFYQLKAGDFIQTKKMILMK